MATDDRQILVTGQAAAPAGFTIPGNGQIKPKAANAIFDGTNAAGDFMPTIEIISDAGIVVARVPAATVLAGGSAEVTFGPFLEQPTVATTTVAQAYALGYFDNSRGDSGVSVNAGASVRATFQHFSSSNTAILSEDSTFGANTAIRLHPDGMYWIVGTTKLDVNPAQLGAIIYNLTVDQIRHYYKRTAKVLTSVPLRGIADTEDSTVMLVSGGSEVVSLMLMNDGSVTGGAGIFDAGYLAVMYLGAV